MYLRRLFVILVFVAVTPGLAVVQGQSSKGPDKSRTPMAAPLEVFSFLIRDFRMDHQGQNNNLNISISYRYATNISKADYPDFRWLAKDIETFLNDYPNEDDYWEILNKQLTANLLMKYPGLVKVTSEIKVDPTTIVPYTRSSRVTRERSPGRSILKRQLTGSLLRREQHVYSPDTTQNCSSR
jgi:hypothetical protein